MIRISVPTSSHDSRSDSFAGFLERRFSPGFIFLLIFLASALPGQARLQEGQDQESGFFERNKLTGDWGGLRDRLSRAGLDVGVVLLVDGSYPTVGGLRERATWQHRLDFSLVFDPEPLLGWKGAEFQFSAYNKAGRPASYDIGDIGVVSNMDAPERTRVYEAFWIQRMPFEWLRMRLGLLNANATFDSIESGGEFLNSTVGLTPTIFDIPTYPQSAPGIELTVEALQYFQLRLGFYDTSHLDGFEPGLRPRRGLLRDIGIDGTMAILELDFERRWLDRRFRVFAGIWGQEGNYSDLDGNSTSGGQGAYGAIEADLLSEETDAQLDIFVSYSSGDPAVSAVSHHFLAGARLTRFWRQRPMDRLGLMYSRVHPNDRLAALTPEPESTSEFFYRLQLAPWFSIQPDLQWIQHPGGQAQRHDVIVALVRMEWVF